MLYLPPTASGPMGSPALSTCVLTKHSTPGKHLPPRSIDGMCASATRPHTSLTSPTYGLLFRAEGLATTVARTSPSPTLNRGVPEDATVGMPRVHAVAGERATVAIARAPARRLLEAVSVMMTGRLMGVLVILIGASKRGGRPTLGRPSCSRSAQPGMQ